MMRWTGTHQCFFLLQHCGFVPHEFSVQPSVRRAPMKQIRVLVHDSKMNSWLRPQCLGNVALKAKQQNQKYVKQKTAFTLLRSSCPAAKTCPIIIAPSTQGQSAASSAQVTCMPCTATRAANAGATDTLLIFADQNQLRFAPLARDPKGC